MGRKKAILDLDIMNEIHNRVPDHVADYIFWRYAPYCLEFEAKTFEELREHSTGFPMEATERTAERWLLDDGAQACVRLLLERKNEKQLLDLHETYVDAAQSDPQALRALLELNKSLFKERESGLMKMLKGLPDDLDGDDNG